MNRLTVRIAAVVAVLACGACAPRVGTAPPSGERLTIAAIDLVTDSGARPGRRSATLTAEEEITRRCMTSLGETYRPFVPPLPAGDDEERLVNLPLRRTRGFDLAEPPHPPSAGPSEKTRRFHVAMFGDGSKDLGVTLPNETVFNFPSTGCVAEGRAAVFGDVVRWARVDSVPQIFNNDLRNQVATHPDLAAAAARWASCMRTAGHPYATPEQARQAVTTAYAQKGDTAQTRADEIIIATIDGDCDLQSDQSATELRLRRSAAAHLSARERHELNELAAIDCAAAVSATRILDTSTVWSATKFPDRGSNMISVWNGDVHGTAEADLFAGVPR